MEPNQTNTIQPNPPHRRRLIFLALALLAIALPLTLVLVSRQQDIRQRAEVVCSSVDCNDTTVLFPQCCSYPNPTTSAIDAYCDAYSQQTGANCFPSGGGCICTDYPIPTPQPDISGLPEIPGSSDGGNIYNPTLTPNIDVAEDEDNGTGGTICTQDAKFCPGGSYVSRTGPNCEFAPCPNVTPTCTPRPNITGDAYPPEPPGGWCPRPTCTPRPACLYSDPPCALETFFPQGGWWCTTTLTPTPLASCALKSRGDANCDGIINTDDFNIWRDDFLKHFETTPFPGQGSPPFRADLNGDGKVDTDDFNVWRDGFLGRNLVCGGIAGTQCPQGYTCRRDGNYPDAGGTCIPSATPTFSPSACESRGSCNPAGSLTCPVGTFCAAPGPYLEGGDNRGMCIPEGCPPPV